MVYNDDEVEKEVVGGSFIYAICIQVFHLNLVENICYLKNIDVLEFM